MQQPSKLKTVVIGTGKIAGVHLKNLDKLNRTELVGVCDIAPGRAEAVAKEHGGRPYTNYEEMLDKEKPQVALLLTPQMVRFEPIKACAERGIPMFIEKPPAKDMETARRTVEVVRKHKLLTSVGFLYRYCKTVERARDLLKDRTIHVARSYYYAPLMLNVSAYRPFYFNNQESGGMVVDQSIHIVDLMRYLVGAEIDEVHGIGSNLFQKKTAEITTDENISLNLRYRNGVVGSHTHIWAYNRWQVEAEFVSPHARLVMDLVANKMTGVVDGMQIEYAPKDDAYETELARFFDAVETGDHSLVRSTYEDSVKTLGVCAAALRSLESRTVEKVELS